MIGGAIEYISLFSGIGGFEVALNQLGAHCVLASEVDEHVANVYKKIHKHVPFGDVREIKDNTIPPCDLLIAGFPCEAFSAMGKREGFEDDRGMLFFEIIRFAKKSQPKMILLENVPGLLTHDRFRTFAKMVSALCDLGYMVDFTLLNSKHYGVPQNRERLYIMAHKDCRLPTIPRQLQAFYVEQLRSRLVKKDGVKFFTFNWPMNTSVDVTLGSCLEDGVADNYYLDDDRVHLYIMDLGSSLKPRIWRKKSAVRNERGVFTSYADKFFMSSMEDRRAGTPKRLATKENISYCILSSYGTGVDNRFALHGNKTIIVESFIDWEMMSDGLMGIRMRKMTPLECLRLQGFPDSVYHSMQEIGCSDIRIYGMAGRAVTVNVAHEIVSRMMPYFKEGGN